MASNTAYDEMPYSFQTHRQDNRSNTYQVHATIIVGNIILSNSSATVVDWYVGN